VTSTACHGRSQAISYPAIAGTLIVHPKDWDDVPRDPKADKAARRLRRMGAEARTPNRRGFSIF